MDLQKIASAFTLISDAFTMLAQGLDGGELKPVTSAEKPAPAPKAEKEKPAPAPEPKQEPESDFMAGLESPPAGYPAKTKADVVSLYHKAVGAHGAPKVNPIVTKVLSGLGFQAFSGVPDEQMGEVFAKLQESFNA